MGMIDPAIPLFSQGNYSLTARKPKGGWSVPTALFKTAWERSYGSVELVLLRRPTLFYGISCPVLTGASAYRRLSQGKPIAL